MTTGEMEVLMEVGGFNLLSAYDVISNHVTAVMQWPVGLNTSCCSSGLTQNLLFQVLTELSEC